MRGVPLDADHEYVGGLFTLLNPYALLGGLTTAALFLTHGAVFIALKTNGDIRERAGALAVRTRPGHRRHRRRLPGLDAGHPRQHRRHRSSPSARRSPCSARSCRRQGPPRGLGVPGTAVTIALAVATLFAALFPNVMPSTLDPAGTLTTANAASTPYTLKIMTWVAVIFTPIVLALPGLDLLGVPQAHRRGEHPAGTALTRNTPVAGALTRGRRPPA